MLQGSGVNHSQQRQPEEAALAAQKAQKAQQGEVVVGQTSTAAKSLPADAQAQVDTRSVVQPQAPSPSSQCLTQRLSALEAELKAKTWALELTQGKTAQQSSKAAVARDGRSSN